MLRRTRIARAAAVATMFGAALLGGALLAGATPAAAGGGGGGCASGVITSASGVTVLTEGLCFESTVLHVAVGATVTWTNDESLPHTVTGANRVWGSEQVISDGQSVSFTFESEGTFPYYCMIHPGMLGTVVVGDGVEGSPTVATLSGGGASGGGASPLPWGLLGTVFGVAIAGVGATAWRRRDAQPPA